MIAARLRGLSPEGRTAAFYLSLWAGHAAIALLSGIWFAERGLSTEEIGIVNAVPLFVMLVATMLVGRIADRAPDWSRTIVLGAVASAVFAIGLGLGRGFWSILPIWTAMMVAHASIVPVIDAAAMRLTARRGSDFGRLRAFGTAGFLSFLLIVGLVARGWGAAAFLPVLIVLSLARAGLALQLPRFRAAPGEVAAADAGATPGRATRLREVMHPWFVVPLAGWAIVFGSHSVINAFMPLLWHQRGIGLDLISVLIAVGALAEMVMFFLFRRLAPRFRARTLILVSALVTCLRWIGMALEPSLPWLFVLQALHGVTYAMGFLACIGFIARWTSEDIAAEAQGFFVSLQQMMAVISLYGFGWLLLRVGEGAWWAAAGLAALGTAGVWWSWRLPPPDGRIG